MKSGNQEQICVKLDQGAYSQLIMESSISGVPSNRIINRAVVAYCQAIDIARGVKAGMYEERQAAGWFLKTLAPWILCESKLSNDLKIMEEVKKWK